MNNEPTWALDNDIQRAICSNAIEELPDGYIYLDDEQQAIIKSTSVSCLI